MCETSGSKPEPSVRWYKDNKTPDDSSDDVEIFINITVSNSDGTIVVTSRLMLVPSRQDSGMRIYCTAKNLAEYAAIQSDRKPLIVIYCKYFYIPTPLLGVISKSTLHIVID